ncbi:hypothetical protein PT974_03834 [Cladobotryum mycophilum]|uniref:rRNA adenine N(6)-methyltransferase n=1 Tax=Cladobotryum mycophilum TaxID=491253 RepID=A0ABR0STI3_9HYPO
MLARLRYGRATWPRLVYQPAIPTGARAYETKESTKLKATTDVAKKLNATGAWKRTGGRKKADAIKANEPRRVNVVSDKLCDDIVNYLGPSLERHKGCDLIDLNPGVGLWSRKLHDALEPRKHIMMDLDAELYQPFLGDLLSKKNVHIIPKSGVLWKDLFEMIHSQLSHQKETPKGELPTRNDTLLVTANLSTYPKKAFLGFDSVSTMVTYQLMSSIRTSSLFQRYGLVRMLIWINDEDKRRLIPKSLQRRKRPSFEAELACEWIHEVAGIDAEAEDRFTLRDEWINLESGYKTVKRMRDQGLVMPKGRETRIYTEALTAGALLTKKLAGTRPPTMSRPFKQELEELEQELEQGEISEASSRLKNLRSREKTGQADARLFLELLQQREEAFQLSMTSPEEFKAADAAWNERIDNMKKNGRNELNVLKDSYHIFRQDPPALLWDRRAYEPLSVKEEEFYPNAPTALLDIQPRTMHPLLLQYGPDSNRAGAMSDIMLRSWFAQTMVPAQKAMEAIYGGFGDLFTECPSLVDPARGGSPMTGRGALTARSINREQWEEIVQAWMNWPFRPPYSRLLGRLDDEGEGEGEDDGGKSTAAGLTF